MPASYDVRIYIYIYISQAPVDMTREWLASLAKYMSTLQNAPGVRTYVHVSCNSSAPARAFMRMLQL